MRAGESIDEHDLTGCRPRDGGARDQLVNLGGLVLRTPQKREAELIILCCCSARRVRAKARLAPRTALLLSLSRSEMRLRYRDGAALLPSAHAARYSPLPSLLLLILLLRSL